MENNNFDNIPEKFQEPSDPFAPQSQATYNSPPPEREPEMSVGNWLIVFLISIIPCVNIIMLIVWAVSNENKTRRNYARAYLIFMVAIFVIGLIFGIALAGMIGSFANSMMLW